MLHKYRTSTYIVALGDDIENVIASDHFKNIDANGDIEMVANGGDFAILLCMGFTRQPNTTTER